MSGFSKPVSYLACLDQINESIQSNNLNLALRKIQYCVLLAITDPLFTAKVFDAQELDEFCSEIGRLSQALAASSRVDGALPAKDKVVFVASRLQISGGHTRVIEDFFRILPHQDKFIYVTEVPGRSDREKVAARLNSLGVQIKWAPAGTLLQRLEWLQQQLWIVRPKDVYLFNHHEDSVAVAAMQAVRDAKIHFYHHGDHHLTLGMHIPGARHIDIHAFGFHNCRNNLGIQNCYLPLAAQDLGTRPESLAFMSDGMLTTSTAAGSNKLEAPHFVKYVDVIPKLLQTTQGRHIHIGRLSLWARFKIKRNILKLGLKPESFIYMPWVPSVWKAMHEFRIDIFIASFPIVGGKTLVEVMGSGTPLVLHDHPTSRFLGGVDMVYPEAFCWRQPDELFNYCNNLTVGKLLKQSLLARQYYDSYYHEELLKRALIDGEICSPPPLNPLIHNIDEDLQAKEIRSQSSLKSLTHKFLYRNFKQLRSWLTSFIG